MFMGRFCATPVVTKSVFSYKRPLNRDFVDGSLLKRSRRVTFSVGGRVLCPARAVGLDKYVNGLIYSQTGITKISIELTS